MAFFKYFLNIKDKIEKEKEFSRAEKALKLFLKKENVLLKTNGAIGYSYYYGIEQPSGERALIVIDKKNDLLFTLAHEIGHYISEKTGSRSEDFFDFETAEEGTLYEDITAGYENITTYGRITILEEEVKAWKFGAQSLENINFKYMKEYEEYAFRRIVYLLEWYGFKG